MAATSRPLQERIPLGSSLWRLSDFFILFLLIALLTYRLASLRDNGAIWLMALVCESWFSFVWVLNMNAKWSPILYKTYPERLSERIDNLPAVDMFVTTADPKLEPPMITVNTVLSLLAIDYPADKLACYVSDDGCSPVTYYSLVEACKFARLWAPFCKRYNIKVRAPFVYFSSRPEFSQNSSNHDHKFMDDWTFMKSEYEKLSSRIENAKEDYSLRHGGDVFTEFVNVERRNHPTIVKVVWENTKNRLGEGFPHLIYVSREKRPKYVHHFKAGAMNVLTRVSGVMTNAPFMLNVDCDMFANNPQVVLHAMCLLLGFDNEIHSGFVQAPQKFYGALKDDPFGNQLVVLFKKLGHGIAGIQGVYYGGTGCFHRRKIIYGMPPDFAGASKCERNAGSPYSYEELQAKHGDSKELIESATRTITGNGIAEATADLSTRIDAAKRVAACNYEPGTCWGQEIGWAYGSMTEDVLTGQRIHAAGWRSAIMTIDPPAFLGSAPTGGPASLTQFKRWSTGLLEILVSWNSPVLAAVSKRLQFRQCLAYLIINVWPLRAPFELCYALLGPYCLLANRSFLPKASEVTFLIPLALFLTYNICTFLEYVECRLSARAWWNNQRMQRIVSATSWLFGFLSVLLKILGVSDTVFEVTRKDQNMPGSKDDDDTATVDPGRFTFDSSPIFVPGTALVISNMLALAVGTWRFVGMTAGDVLPGGPGIGEFVCCGWLVLCFWPFVRGLAGKGSYGIPWPVIWKASLLVAVFLHLCRKSLGKSSIA